MARQTIPTAIKAARGTLKPERVNKSEIQLFGDKVLKKPNPPKDFSKWAISEWNTAWEFLCRYKIAAEVDKSLVTAYSREMGRYLECAEIVESKGMVFKNQHGLPIKNPYISIGNDALAIALRIGVQFGFTSSSRADIVAPMDMKRDGLSQLLSEKPKSKFG